jgi:hypothetical protein
MGKIVNLSFKVPEEIHKKLKVISALSGKSMSDIIIDFVKKQKVSIPAFDDKPEKTKVVQVEILNVKPEKTKSIKVGIRKDQNPDADENLIKEEILKYKADGLSLRKIADALNDAAVPTLRGAPQWAYGTVDGLLQKYAAQDA